MQTTKHLVAALNHDWAHVDSSEVAVQDAYCSHWTWKAGSKRTLARQSAVIWMHSTELHRRYVLLGSCSIVSQVHACTITSSVILVAVKIFRRIEAVCWCSLL